MRIGIMGGTLDPVHNGHVQLAQAALISLKLDGVMLLPAGDPPHKLHTTSGRNRLEMVRLAVQNEEHIFPCNIEVQRAGITYTVDTLCELAEKNPDTQWFYIIGADTLRLLESWKNFSSVAQMCTFLVCGRADEAASLSCMAYLEEKYSARFVCLDFTGPDISSTEIRRRICKGIDASGLVPAAVNEYILKKGLYLSALGKDEILKKLQTDLKKERFNHTIGVAEVAVRLAKRYGIDPMQAELAALLHDCAKAMPLEEMRRRVLAEAMDVDSQELNTTSVLHAPAGAAVARTEYGIEHTDILSAIRKHTLGAPVMSPLDALIYTADFIEPGRKDFPGLAHARQLAEHDLYAAMCLCAELTSRYLGTMGERMHPRSVAMLKNYQTSINKEEAK